MCFLLFPLCHGLPPSDRSWPAALAIACALALPLTSRTNTNRPYKLLNLEFDRNFGWKTIFMGAPTNCFAEAAGASISVEAPRNNIYNTSHPQKSIFTGPLASRPYKPSNSSDGWVRLVGPAAPYRGSGAPLQSFSVVVAPMVTPTWSCSSGAHGDACIVQLPLKVMSTMESSRSQSSMIPCVTSLAI